MKINPEALITSFVNGLAQGCAWLTIIALGIWLMPESLRVAVTHIAACVAAS